MRKIFLFFIFFLFLFLSAKQAILAANSNNVPCTISISTRLIKDITEFDVSIVSNKSLTPGGSFYVQYLGDAFLSAGPSSIDEKVADSNGDIIYKKITGSGHLSAGTFKIYVFKKAAYGKPGDAGNYECESSDFSVNESSIGQTCAVRVSSGTNKTTDPVSFTVEFFDKQNDSRKVWVLLNGGASNTVKQYSSFNNEECQKLTDLENPGFSLGTLGTGTYDIKIGSDCYGSDDPANAACSATVPISAAGGGTNTGGTTTCYFCPVGCTYSSIFSTTDEEIPSCKDPSGGACTATSLPAGCDSNSKICTGHCNSATEFCDPNHVYGCAGANGLPVNTSTAPTNPPFCNPNADGNYICHTAIGDVITSPQGFVSKLFGIVLSLSGGIALLLIIISGYKILSSQGNPEALKGAKEQLTAAIVGLLFIIFALVILQIIGVDILHIPGFE